MRAYYFSNLDKKLRYGDNRLIEVGITHEVKFPYVYGGATFYKPTLCKAGTHGSVKALDALHYAPGEYLWIVDIEGDIEEGENKICGSSRTYLAGFDATELLKKFYKKIVLDVFINNEKIKEYFHENQYDIILRFLSGEDSLRRDSWHIVYTAFKTVKTFETSSDDYYSLKFIFEAIFDATFDRTLYAWDITTAVCRYYSFEKHFRLSEMYNEMNNLLESMIEEELKNIETKTNL